MLIVKNKNKWLVLQFCLLVTLLLGQPSEAVAGQWVGQVGPLFSLGHNYSAGAYGQVLAYTNWQYGNFNARFATGVVGRGSDSRISFLGLTAEAAYTVPIPHFPFEFRLAYNFVPHFQSTIMEQDLALMGSYQGRHLATGLGYQVRFNSSLDGGTKYAEYANYLYMFELFIWPQGHRYNISAGVKNYDLLNYGLDPLLNVTMYYTLSGGQRLVIEGLYQGAGVGPILFNHYDFKVRFGVLWGV